MSQRQFCHCRGTLRTSDKRTPLHSALPMAPRSQSSPCNAHAHNSNGLLPAFIRHMPSHMLGTMFVQLSSALPLHYHPAYRLTQQTTTLLVEVPALQGRTAMFLTIFSSWRRLPVHCMAAATVCRLNLVFRSSRVNVTALTPSPVTHRQTGSHDSTCRFGSISLDSNANAAAGVEVDHVAMLVVKNYQAVACDRTDQRWYLMRPEIFPEQEWY